MKHYSAELVGMGTVDMVDGSTNSSLQITADDRLIIADANVTGTTSTVGLVISGGDATMYLDGQGRQVAFAAGQQSIQVIGFGTETSAIASTLRFDRTSGHDLGTAADFNIELDDFISTTAADNTDRGYNRRVSSALFEGDAAGGDLKLFYQPGITDASTTVGGLALGTANAGVSVNLDSLVRVNPSDNTVPLKDNTTGGFDDSIITQAGAAGSELVTIGGALTVGGNSLATDFAVTGNSVLTGNLTVTGTTRLEGDTIHVGSEITTHTDSYIEVGNATIGSPFTAQSGGLVVVKTATLDGSDNATDDGATGAGIRYNQAANQWEINNDIASLASTASINADTSWVAIGSGSGNVQKYAETFVLQGSTLTGGTAETSHTVSAATHNVSATTNTGTQSDQTIYDLTVTIYEAVASGTPGADGSGDAGTLDGVAPFNQIIPDGIAVAANGDVTVTIPTGANNFIGRIVITG